jgi:hypothetical protein
VLLHSFSLAFRQSATNIRANTNKHSAQKIAFFAQGKNLTIGKQNKQAKKTVNPRSK